MGYSDYFAAKAEYEYFLELERELYAELRVLEGLQEDQRDSNWSDEVKRIKGKLFDQCGVDVDDPDRWE